MVFRCSRAPKHAGEDLVYPQMVFLQQSYCFFSLLDMIILGDARVSYKLLVTHFPPQASATLCRVNISGKVQQPAGSLQTPADTSLRNLSSKLKQAF